MPHPFQLRLHPSTCDLEDPEGRVVSIPIGPVSLSNLEFRGLVPTDLELEYAIACIEDDVMPLDKNLSPLRRVLRVSNNIPAFNLDGILMKHQVLSLNEFETTFNRALFEKPPRDCIAALLIIRECLHHLRFTQLYYD